MPSLQKVIDAIDMIDKQHLDIRTITMGISLLDCASEDVGRCCEKIYDKICHKAENLVQTGESIEREFGIPIVNKRISVTPMALVAGSCQTEDFVPFALTMDRAAKTCGVDFIGGFSALVQKGFSKGDELLLRSIPQALAQTDLVCSSVNVGSTKAGINMDAVARMGRIIRDCRLLEDGAPRLPQPKLTRNPCPHIPIAEREKNFREVDLTMSTAEARNESLRCMRCYRLFAVVTPRPIPGNDMVRGADITRTGV